MDSLNVSAYGSLFLQLTTGLFEGHGLFLTIPPEDKILQEILFLELTVQFIEFLFYIYLVYMIYYQHVTNKITSHRYVDWSLTTPAMLVSFVMFFKYLKNPKRNISLVDSLKEENTNILKIVIGNAFMLFFGFLGEINIINKPLGVALGFIPFAYVFKILYSEYGKYTTLSQIIFYASFLIWGLYGVAAVFPFAVKNTFYNILDLFAKNAYGLFLYFFIRSKAI